MIHAASARLALRDVEPCDIDAVHAFASDPEVTRWTDWGPNTRVESQDFVEAAVAEARTPPRSALSLAVVRRADDRLAGTASVWTTAARHRRGGLGYVLHPAVWGQGLATETARLLVRLGTDRLALHRVEATCHPDNVASARVLEKIGMRCEGHLADHLLVRGQWRDSLLHAVIVGGPPTVP